MTWHTVILNPDLSAYLQAEARFPYLTALCLTRPESAGKAVARLNNLLAARAQEQQRPAGAVEARPYHLVIDPSSACNLRCPLCVQATDPLGRKRTLIQSEPYADLMQQVTDHAIRIDLFNWGEPLLNPAFHDILSHTASADLYARTSSNLSLRGCKVSNLPNSGLRYLVASIDGATQATYAQYRVRGRLDIAIENLAAITRAKRERGTVFPIVEWQFLAFSHNVHEIDLARAMAAECGADVFRYGGGRARMSAKTRHSDADAFDLSRDLLLDPDHALSEYDPSGNRTRQDERANCRWLWGKMALNADGGVSPCWNGWFDETDVGDWRNTRLDDIWNGSELRRARRMVSGADAKDRSMCGTCAANRSFVPTPDFDREDLLHSDSLAAVISGLRSAGLEPPNRLVDHLDRLSRPPDLSCTGPAPSLTPSMRTEPPAAPR